MKRILILCLSLAVFGGGQAHAVVGKTYLTAYDKTKGSQAKAGKYGKQILLRTSATKAAKKTETDAKAKTAKTNTAKTNTAKTKKGLPTLSYDQSVRYCGKTYYVTKRGKAWIAAHKRAKHTLVVRRHAAKGKYTVVCGKPPKRVVAKTKTKKTATEKPAAKTN